MRHESFNCSYSVGPFSFLLSSLMKAFTVFYFVIVIKQDQYIYAKLNGL